MQENPEILSEIKPKPTLIALGFDYGLRRVGIAVGNSYQGTARPLTTLVNNNNLFAEIKKIIKEWQPNILVIGLALTLDGQEQTMSIAARDFAKKLGNEIKPKLKITFADEAYSSTSAESEIRERRQSGQMKRRRQAADVDQIAAAIFLESWLKKYNETGEIGETMP